MIKVYGILQRATNENETEVWGHFFECVNPNCDNTEELDYETL